MPAHLFTHWHHAPQLHVRCLSACVYSCQRRACRGGLHCCRAGLYKQMAELKALVSEYRENPVANAALKERVKSPCLCISVHLTVFQ